AALPPQQAARGTPAAGGDLVRRARGHQPPRDLAQRQHPRHAGLVPARSGPGRPHRHRLRGAQARPEPLLSDRAARPRRGGASALARVGHPHLHHGRHRSSWHGGGDGGSPASGARRRRHAALQLRHRRGRPQGGPGHGHPQARRAHLPRGAPGPRDHGRDRAPDQHGDGGDQPHPRRGQQDRRAGGGADRVGAGLSDPVAKRGTIARAWLHASPSRRLKREFRCTTLGHHGAQARFRMSATLPDEPRPPRLPHTMVLIFGLLCLVALVGTLVPGGAYARDEAGRVLPGTFAYDASPIGPRGWALLMAVLSAPVRGLVQSADIVGFILVVGGTFRVIERSGALEAGIVRAVMRLRGRERWFVPMTMLMFSAGGAVFGMSEEVIPFVLLLVPLVRGLGHPPIVAVAVPMIGAGVGFAGAMLNPFTVGVAQAIAGLPPMSGWPYRTAVWAV